MASLQARHSRACGASYRGKFRPADLNEGCTCKPTFYIAVAKDGKVVKQPVGRNRRHADSQLKIVAGKVAEDTYEPVRNIPFDRWADEWLRGLEVSENTKDDYTTTIALYAKPTFGRKVVRRLGADDVRRFNELTREKCPSDTTRAKHLGNLKVCLNDAIRSGYANSNPADKVKPPRARDREAGYFEDGELAALFPELRDGLYRTLFQVALSTGMRQGEIVALQWGDIDFAANLIHVRRSYTNGRLSTPKSGSVRHVAMTPELITALGNWKNEVGDPTNEQLVFPGSSASGYLSTSTLTKRVLYPAMERAGIDRIGPTGEARTFHSLRHSFARVALENGKDLYWVSAQLGHSSYRITEKVYAHFSMSANRAQAAGLEGAFAGAFAA
jgi:integrase